MTKYHKPGASTVEIYCLPVLEARRPLQARRSAEPLGGLFQATDGQACFFLRTPQRVCSSRPLSWLVGGGLFPVTPHHLACMHVCVQIYFSFKEK